MFLPSPKPKCRKMSEKVANILLMVGSPNPLSGYTSHAIPRKDNIKSIENNKSLRVLFNFWHPPPPPPPPTPPTPTPTPTPPATPPATQTPTTTTTPATTTTTTTATTTTTTSPKVKSCKNHPALSSLQFKGLPHVQGLCVANRHPRPVLKKSDLMYLLEARKCFFCPEN